MNDAQKKYGFMGASIGFMSAALALRSYKGEKKINSFLALSVGAVIGFIIIPPVYSYLLDQKKAKK